jgi:hypothetical protein
MVNSPGASSLPSAYAPVNEQSRPGLIKYLNQGAASVIAKRREDAYRQMYEACGGRYNIDAEGPVGGEGYIMPMTGGGYLTAQSEYWGISFSCLGP